MTDWTRLIDRLDPPADGESPVRHRTGIVDAINPDGTVDLFLSGFIVPSVSVLAGAAVSVGATVQMISWSGDLLVLGTSGHRGGLVLIEERVLSSTTGTVDLAVPAGFSDLYLTIVAKGTASSIGLDVEVRFNNNTGTVYDTLRVRNTDGTLSGLQAMGATSGFISTVPAADSPTGVWGGGWALIRGVSDTGVRTNWDFMDRHTRSASVQRTHQGSGEFRSTAVVSSIQLFPSSGSFVAGSRFVLRGMT